MVNTTTAPKAEIVSDRWVKATWEKFKTISEDPNYVELCRELGFITITTQ